MRIMKDHLTKFEFTLFVCPCYFSFFIQLSLISHDAFTPYVEIHVIIFIISYHKN